jgi:predicted dehydrogenase
MGAARPDPLRIGVIGGDTSHAPAFAALLNADAKPAALQGAVITALWPQHSADLELSRGRIDGFCTQLQQQHGLHLVQDINQLAQHCDAVMILSLDGRRHLAQAREVIATRKPFFVDKPLAASLGDAIALVEEAAEAQVPFFSSSATRFWPEVQAMAQGGPAVSAEASGPAPSLPGHPDWFFYAIHSAEALFTLMGASCESVSCQRKGNRSLAQGLWSGGRRGSVLALHDEPMDSRAYGLRRLDPGKPARSMQQSANYQGLLEAVVRFFFNLEPPVSADETLRLHAFLMAAELSAQQGGLPVYLEDLLRQSKGRV